MTYAKVTKPQYSWFFSVFDKISFGRRGPHASEQGDFSPFLKDPRRAQWDPRKIYKTFRTSILPQGVMLLIEL